MEVNVLGSGLLGNAPSPSTEEESDMTWDCSREHLQQAPAKHQSRQNRMIFTREVSLLGVHSSDSCLLPVLLHHYLMARVTIYTSQNMSFRETIHIVPRKIQTSKDRLFVGWLVWFDLIWFFESESFRTEQSRLALNRQSSCLIFPSSRITTTGHQREATHPCLKVWASASLNFVNIASTI